MIEFECWQYSSKLEFPHNIVKSIVSKCGMVDGIFISTNPMVLNALPSYINTILVYPRLSLKDEYIKRFVNRGSSEDFISTLSEYWEPWIVEAMANNQSRHIVLKSGQYLESVLPKSLTSAMHSDGQQSDAAEIWTNEDESAEIERQIVEDACR